MLLWQRQARPRRSYLKKYSFLTKLWGVSALLHGVTLFYLLFLYKDDRHTQQLDLFTDIGAITVKVLPFQTIAEHKKSAAIQGMSHAPVPEPPAHKTMLARIVKKKKKHPVLAKAAAKKEKPQPKQLPPEPVAPAPLPVVQSIPTQEIAYAGQVEMEAIKLCEEVRACIETTWKPPSGIARGRCCKVRVLVGWNGKAQEIVFEEPSHILAFDTSVRHALLAAEFPKSAYGKELILPFKQ